MHAEFDSSICLRFFFMCVHFLFICWFISFDIGVFLLILFFLCFGSFYSTSSRGRMFLIGSRSFFEYSYLLEFRKEIDVFSFSFSFFFIEEITFVEK